jgi:hypothetical protein
MAGGRILMGKLLGSHPVGRQEENGRMACRDTLWEQKVAGTGLTFYPLVGSDISGADLFKYSTTLLQYL